jgi:hypothetical protein
MKNSNDAAFCHKRISVQTASVVHRTLNLALSSPF